MNLLDKIIAFDIDGTLATNSSFPSEYTYKKLNELVNKGYHITLVTGRSIVSSIDIYKKASLNKALVLCNGALVFDPITNTKFRNVTIKKDILLNILNNKELMEMIDDILVEIDYTSYALTGNAFKNADVIGDLSKILPSEPNSLVLMVKDQKYQSEVAKIINNSNDYHYRYWVKMGEFYSLHFSKKEGVAEMLKLYNKTFDDLIFFGDAENDQELLKAAGIGVAMNNADEKTKACADQITRFTNEEDGAIKHLIEMIG